MTAFFIPNAIQITTRTAKYTFASFLSRDTTYDVLHNIWRLARPDAESIASGEASARQSFDNPRLPSGEADVPDYEDTTVRGVPKINKVTQCKCGKEGAHYPETAMNTVFPGTPDKIYNLMFTSGFIKDFMRVEQKLRGTRLYVYSCGCFINLAIYNVSPQTCRFQIGAWIPKRNCYHAIFPTSNPCPQASALVPDRQSVN